MKPILIVLSVALSALACLETAVRDEAGAEPGEAAMRQVAPSIEDNDFLSSRPSDPASCRSTCVESYQACLSAAEDAVSECLCFDASVSCEGSCGVPGGLLAKC
jgi:hypothetical protein